MHIIGFILLSIGGISSVAAIIILAYKKGERNLSSEERFGVLLISVAFAFGSIGTGVTIGYEKIGKPKTSIETGDYSIISYAETMSGDEHIYQMILKQNNKIEFYALPKEMVVIDKSNGKAGTLEVIEKAGFTKAIMRP